MKQYKVIFFDLDRTLIDFDANAQSAFKEMYSVHHLEKLGIPDDKHFYKRYSVHNLMLWELYNSGEIMKETLKFQRFKLTLDDFKIKDELLAVKLSNDYIDFSMRYNRLFPYTLETLDYLKNKKYKLAIITNGFVEVQHPKIKKSGLDKYFNYVITSDEIGYKKPDARIFHQACALTNDKIEDAIMIGDDLQNDIIGAANAGMDSILFNPNDKYQNSNVKYEIKTLNQLKNIL